MKVGEQAKTAEWFEVHTRYGECEVALNPSARGFRELYRKLEAPYTRYKRKHDGQLPPGVDEKIAREAVAKMVIMDWRNVDDAEGNPIPFSEDAAMKALSDPVVGDQLLNGIMDAANALWEAFAVELDEAEKN